MIALLLLLSSPAWAAPGPKYRAPVFPLSALHAQYFGTRYSDFWSLIGYYVPQKDGGACGPASIAMVLNAIRARGELKSSDRIISQEDLYRRMDIFKEGGDPGTRGVGLEGLGRLMTRAMRLFSIQGWQVEVVRAEANPKFKERIHLLLAENEENANDFIIPLFLQGVYTGDAEGNSGGHFAPIGAY